MLLRHIAMGFRRTISLGDTLKMCLLHVALFVENQLFCLSDRHKGHPYPSNQSKRHLMIRVSPVFLKVSRKSNNLLVEKTTAKTEKHSVHRIGVWMKCPPQQRSRRWMWKE